MTNMISIDFWYICKHLKYIYISIHFIIIIIYILYYIIYNICMHTSFRTPNLRYHSQAATRKHAPPLHRDLGRKKFGGSVAATPCFTKENDLWDKNEIADINAI